MTQTQDHRPISVDALDRDSFYIDGRWARPATGDVIEVGAAPDPTRPSAPGQRIQRGGDRALARVGAWTLAEDRAQLSLDGPDPDAERDLDRALPRRPAGLSAHADLQPRAQVGRELSREAAGRLHPAAPRQGRSQRPHDRSWRHATSVASRFRAHHR